MYMYVCMYVSMHVYLNARKKIKVVGKFSCVWKSFS